MKLIKVEITSVQRHANFLNDVLRIILTRSHELTVPTYPFYIPALARTIRTFFIDEIYRLIPSGS